MEQLKPEIVDRIRQLAAKYESMGQDLVSYLDGLLYSDYLTYWDYIHLDTLLTLIQPEAEAEAIVENLLRRGLMEPVDEVALSA